VRNQARAGDFSVHVIAGSNSVLLAMDCEPAAKTDLLGFAIGVSRDCGERRWLRGFKFFEALVPDPRPGERRSTRDHPIQSFLWGDYSAEPGERYEYTIRPLYLPQDGDLANLRPGIDLTVEVRTEPADRGRHAVFFNRGAVPSQAFADRFGNSVPDEEDVNAPEVRWLSRGLLEAALAFIGQARGPRFALRAAVYEFRYRPVIDALAMAAGSGADVRIVYEAGSSTEGGVTRPTSVARGNEEAIVAFGFDRDLLVPRRNRREIPHNKFIVLLDNGRPVEVWTGSTNITGSGFLGQSNVGHIVRDEAVAAEFLVYWEQLAADPAIDPMQAWCSARTPEPPEVLPGGITTIFSPRERSRMLDWYGRRIEGANQTVMLTAAFGVTERLARYFDNDRDFLRFLLMERSNSKPETQAMLERDRDTRIAIGPTLNRDAIALQLEGANLDVWFREAHYRDRGGGHVFYVHTKILAVDPLGENPLICTGSANFSPASLLDNDENMLLIAADRHVADIYTTEFFRLFNHLYFRYVAQETAKRGAGDVSRIVFLDPTDGWAESSFRQGTYHHRRRELFRAPP
jgi:phosphatidylserine/phosphatidylglycerophosphate/cardiolipin synthase-like enzyme